VVDLPLEVNYKVNNKFIKGTSIAAGLAEPFSGSVTFSYPAVPRWERTSNRGLVSEGIAGTPAAGLVAKARLYGPGGRHLFDVSVQAPPLAHYVEIHRRRFHYLALALLLGALVVWFLGVFVLIPDRAVAVRTVVLVVFLGFLRFSLLALPTAVPGGKLRLFDPVIFATPALWGLMRSPGDLLITSVFLVVAVYGVLKLQRGSPRRERSARAWMHLAMGAFAGALFLPFYPVLRRFVATVVANANPKLIGETVDFFDPQVVVLHLSVFFTVTGLVLAYLLVVWGLGRLLGGTTARAAPAGLAVVLVAAPFMGWQFALTAVLVLLFAFFAPRLVHREDLVSLVMAAFYFVAVTSLVAYGFFNADYQGLKRVFIQERVAELANPADNWKIFILEDILDKLAQDPSLRRRLASSDPSQRRRLAFDLWAESSLSLLGYSSAVYVLDDRDSLISRFAVEMPFRADPAGGRERIDTPAGKSKAVLDLTRDTPQGAVKYYRGIVLAEQYGVDERGSVARRFLGRVIIDLPYFFENLAWAARTGPRTPEILRNVQEGAVEPRLEEPEALLLARIEGGRVVDSSSDDLPPGRRLEEQLLDEAAQGRWPLLDLGRREYRVLAEGGLLAGYQVPSPLWHLLGWSTVLSLYFLFAFATIAVMILLKRVPLLSHLMPTLTPGRRLGFQQKLLLSFFLVAAVPAVVLGVFSSRMIENRFREESKKEALTRAQGAEKALENLLHDELDLIDLPGRQLVPGVQELGGGRILAVVPEDSLPHLVSERVALLGDGVPYVGVYAGTVTLEEEIPRNYVVFYGRRLDGDLLGRIAEQVGSDIVAYRGGELVAASSEGLVAGGFVSAIMNDEAFLRVSLLGVQHALATEKAGRYRYQVAYLPLEDWPVKGALGLPLLFRPESFSAEVQKATTVVLDIFALLFAATIGLGLLLARGIFQPLRGLIEGTRRISRGEFSFKLPQRGEDEIGSVVKAFNEMTDQLERSQRTLEQRRRYLETILAGIGTGVISTDKNLRMTTVNRAAEGILGVSSQELLGRTPQEAAARQMAPAFFAALEKAATSDEPFVSSEVTLPLSGRRATVKFMATRLTFEGRFLGMVFVFEDLTELISSKKLSAWVEMARQIAHEIKNPLTPNKLSTQFMLRAYREGSQDFPRIFEESSETIMQQVEVLRKIAGEFSSFGKMRELDVGSHLLAPLVEEIVEPYRKNASGVEVTFSASRRDIRALVDPEALRKICTNLVENALEAMPQGGKLRVEVGEAQGEDGRMAVVTFTDTGPGLSEEVKERLFEPYFSTKTQGTGLGLAICRSLSRDMGGDVTLENLPGGGGAVATLKLKVDEGQEAG